MSDMMRFSNEPEGKDWRLNIYSRNTMSPQREYFDTLEAAEGRLLYYRFKQDPNVRGIMLQWSPTHSGLYWRTKVGWRLDKDGIKHYNNV